MNLGVVDEEGLKVVGGEKHVFDFDGEERGEVVAGVAVDEVGGAVSVGKRGEYGVGNVKASGWDGGGISDVEKEDFENAKDSPK